MKNKLVIRHLSEKDIEGIVEVEEICFPTPWSKNAFQKELENKLARYMIVEMENKIVAYGGIWFIVDEGHITNIAVHPEYRGLGLGNEIVEALVKECKKNNIISMTLEVRASNHVAQNLYKKYGFKLAGIRPEYYTDNREDALIMWKELNEGV